MRTRAAATLFVALSIAAIGCGGGDDGGDDLTALPAAFHVDADMGTGHPSCVDTAITVDVTGATGSEPRLILAGDANDMYVCAPVNETAGGWNLACQSVSDSTATVAITRARGGTLTVQYTPTIRCDWAIVDVVEQ